MNETGKKKNFLIEIIDAFNRGRMKQRDINTMKAIVANQDSESNFTSQEILRRSLQQKHDSDLSK